jgi:hypothetical protein
MPLCEQCVSRQKVRDTIHICKSFEKVSRTKLHAARVRRCDIKTASAYTITPFSSRIEQIILLHSKTIGKIAYEERFLVLRENNELNVDARGASWNIRKDWDKYDNVCNVI